MSLKVQALDHLVVNVADVEASAAWYRRVLGMTRADVPPAVGKPPRTEMRFGEQKINLRPVAANKEDWFTADHERAGSDDLCFLTASEAARGRSASQGRRRRNRDRSRREKRRARNADLRLLPRPRRQPDRNRILRGQLDISRFDRRQRRHWLSLGDAPREKIRVCEFSDRRR